MPYEGKLSGIEPSLVSDVLYVTTGEFSGKIVHTLKACDYEIIFQDTNGQEGRLIRFRHFPDEENEREEVIAIDDYLTDKLNRGELLVGLTPNKAEKI
jgi:negative regulator of sigma E activity